MTEHARPKPSIAKSAGIVGAAVMISRILGLLREKAIAYYFAAGIGGDVILAAFRIPNLLRDLFAEGALSKSFITTFTATEIEDGEAAAWRLANRTLNVLGLLLAMVTFAGILATPLIVEVMFLGDGFDVQLDPQQHFGFANKRDLTIQLTRIIFPFLMLISFAAIAMGILNSKGIFGIPALASSFFNLTAMIVGIGGYYILPALNYHPTIGMALGFLLGGAAQLFVQVPALGRVGFRWQPLIRINDKRLKQIVRLTGPALLGVAALQINVFVNSIFASEGDGWLSWISRSFRLLHLPIGMFGVAISTAALPSLAKLAAAGDMEKFRHTFANGFRLVLLLTLPSMVGLMLLAEPISRLIFEGGASTSTDTQQTAAALFCFSFGLIGYAALKIVTDAFYATQDTKTPMLVSLFTIALNIGLNYLFIYHFNMDHRSLAIATATTVNLNFIILLTVLHRRNQGLGLGGLPVYLLKLCIASTLLAMVCYGSNIWLEATLGYAGLTAQAIAVFVPVLAGGFVFAGAGWLLRIQEVITLASALKNRFGP